MHGIGELAKGEDCPPDMRRPGPPLPGQLAQKPALYSTFLAWRLGYSADNEVRPSSPTCIQSGSRWERRANPIVLPNFILVVPILKVRRFFPRHQQQSKLHFLVRQACFFAPASPSVSLSLAQHLHLPLPIPIPPPDRLTVTARLPPRLTRTRHLTHSHTRTPASLLIATQSPRFALSATEPFACKVHAVNEAYYSLYPTIIIACPIT